MDKTGQGWLVQLMEHVTKLPLVATDPRDVLTIGFSERADQRILRLISPLLSRCLVSIAILTLRALKRCGPGHSSGLGGLGDGWSGAWRCPSRRAYFENEEPPAGRSKFQDLDRAVTCRTSSSRFSSFQQCRCLRRVNSRILPS